MILAASQEPLSMDLFTVDPYSQLRILSTYQEAFRSQKLFYLTSLCWLESLSIMKLPLKMSHWPQSFEVSLQLTSGCKELHIANENIGRFEFTCLVRGDRIKLHLGYANESESTIVPLSVLLRPV